MASDPHIVVLGVVTIVVGYFMMLAAVEKSALEWKRRRRTCPSCGRDVSRGICRCVS